MKMSSNAPTIEPKSSSIKSSPARYIPAKVGRPPTKANSRLPVFDVQSFLDSAGLGRKLAKFQGKETIFVQDDPANNVMYIQEGGVKLTVVNETGKEAIVAILGPGDFFGGRVPCRPVHSHGHCDYDCTHHRSSH